MINENELRIGNIVTYDNKNVLVTGLLSGNVVVSCNGIPYRNRWSRPCDIYPVELDGGTLEKCGFIKDGNQDYWIDLQTNYLKAMPMNDGVYPIWCCLAELSSEKEQFASLNRINHLHQLQNLYFALTGQELTITP